MLLLPNLLWVMSFELDFLPFVAWFVHFQEFLLQEWLHNPHKLNMKLFK